ncbi:uncharacterized protein LOC119739088 [Patiria miniata]|uniref:Uncharacterized protein n=1 Tax=Patiria miniata TaxID=46514 RepID=A0A914B0C5_PATMI|nr:uncharacterized protein LOC119739088 [Patiria miniata]
MSRAHRSLNLSPGGPAVNVALMDDFLAAPPDFFTFARDDGRKKRRRPRLTHDPERVIVCARSAKFLNSKGGCLMVRNESDLETITEDLLTLPLVFSVLVKRYHKSGSTSIAEKGKAVVIVNTQHPVIKEHFEKLLSKAMRLMRKGKRFALEFDFNKVIEEWMQSAFVWAGHDDGDTSCLDRQALYVSMHGKVTVTNHGRKAEVFACRDVIKSEELAMWWALCFPCCLCVCPVYKVQRALLVTDLGGRVEGVNVIVFLPLGELGSVPSVTQAPLPSVGDSIVAGREEN